MTLSSELLIATRNAGKIREFSSLLADLRIRIRTPEDFPGTGEVEETGATFAENAALKAQFYSAQTGLWTLADDSGLEVDALGGAPGVHSARYAGPGASDGERIDRLLAELTDTRDSDRRARFVCVIAIARRQNESMNFFTGVCEGRIAHEARGTNGFGYDPVFIPEGHAQTFGELSPAVKHNLSHRARAVEAARMFLRTFAQHRA